MDIGDPGNERNSVCVRVFLTICGETEGCTTEREYMLVCSTISDLGTKAERMQV